MTATTSARHPAARRTEARDATGSKSTPYGRALLRAIERMKAAGPWKFARKSSDRYFRR